ncbi:MAG: 2-dehydropantoate 2-reductase N-terminal domain-containing protein [Christensenellales bacterium]
MRSKEIAIVGAGKIGRGYLSDLFSRAGYHLIFINGSPVTIDKLNEQGYYTLFTAKADGLTNEGSKALRHTAPSAILTSV